MECRHHERSGRPKSAAFISFIGPTRGLHPDFGGEESPGSVNIYGMPIAVVDGTQAKKAVSFLYSTESDGVDHTTNQSFPFYPIPDEAITQAHWVEGGPPGNVDLRNSADRHLLIVDKDNKHLYELYNVFHDGTAWRAGSGAFFDMKTNNRRPDTWTSADAAGLAIVPGLVRYDEVFGPDEIGHAFRVTLRASNGYVYPASHAAGSNASALPMGARLRLKAGKDISSFPPTMQKIFRAFKKYGLIMADNGSDMYISGTFDTRWDNDVLNPAFAALKASDFEVVELGYVGPPLRSLSIDRPSMLEGDGGTTNATFTVSLSAASSQTVTVSYATSGGTATAGSDYDATSGTLTFPPSTTSQSVTVSVIGDTTKEPNETFFVSLSSPANATIAVAQGIGTILNDDAPGVARTVCPSGCTGATIQSAIDASVAGDTVWVKSNYDSIAAGEVFPIQTLAINPSGAITITGETDGNGNPITTVKTRNGPTDGFSIVSPGSVLQDLKIIPGDASKINRVIAASRNAGVCPGATCHLNGLTIQNVMIDFSTTFNTGNGIDLRADNVVIDRVTIKGIAGRSIFMDGDNSTVQSSTLDGRDPSNGNAIRGVLAIGFAADQRVAGVACSGFPSNYNINSNTITGYADGIQWCSGRANTIQNNAITDISGKGIDTSGSLGTQIFGNVLRQNTTGGRHGIGLFKNAFQTCSGNTVRNNKVLGRAARDMTFGITVQSCLDTTIFQNEVRNSGLYIPLEFVHVGAIDVRLGAGTATKTTIQGNTVIGGGTGINYFGADRGATAVDQSVIRDNVVNEFTRDGIVVQFIKGVRSGAGAGNVVAYNTVRAVDQGNEPNTHAFNLQNLANTAFDRNTALDTKGGYGFFLANSTGVNGNCNTGAANGGGLFAQVNVTPTYGNANVNCRVGLYSHYDFDGDGKSDVAMYRHTTGQWFIRRSSDGLDTVTAFGAPGSDDIPAPGNYTVAGKTDIAIYRYTTGEWYIRRATDGGTTLIKYGSPLVGDVPMPADYDGDGITDIAVFRVSTANAEWYIRRSSDLVTQYVAWGCAACADLGVPGDYDGDGKADVAVYRRSTGDWFIRKSTDTALQQVSYGSVSQGDLPVPGRYTTTAKTDMAVYRSLTGEFLIRRSTDFGTTSVPFGSPAAGDLPVSADFTQPGITDIAVYRPTPPVAQFLIRRSTDLSTLTIPYGNPGSQDAPLTAR